MQKNSLYNKVVPFLLFILSIIIAFYLIKPMITILLSSILLAYVAYPIYIRLFKKTNLITISIIISLLIIFIIILIPFLFIAFEISQQGYFFYNSLSEDISKGALFGFGCTSADSKICSVLNQAEKFSTERLVRFGFDAQVEKFLLVIENKVTQFILRLPIIFAQIFLTWIIAYFILKDWEAILEKFIQILPMRTKTIKRLKNEFGNIAYTVIYAQLFVAFIQGAISAIGFYLFGVPFPIFLGVIVAFCALIPTIGTALVWVPASLVMVVIGYFSKDYWLMTRGIGLFLYGLFIISTIDNLLLAKIVQHRTKINQITIIIGVIGGGSLFGFIGIFIGPIILPLLITYFETFKERYN